MASSKGAGRRHTHKEKRSESRGYVRRTSLKYCDSCGKLCYLSRDDAKKAARNNHPGQTMHVYECEEPSGRRWWHISSIPAMKLEELKNRKWE